VRGGGRAFGKVACLGLIDSRLLIALVDKLEEVADCTG
jgi:hypothetical protein